MLSISKITQKSCYACFFINKFYISTRKNKIKQELKLQFRTFHGRWKKISHGRKFQFVKCHQRIIMQDNTFKRENGP